MNKNELVGKKFFFPGEGLFHIAEVTGDENRLAIHWFAEEGHRYSGSTSYYVSFVSAKVAEGSWKLVEEEQEEVSDYSIF